MAMCIHVYSIAFVKSQSIVGLSPTQEHEIYVALQCLLRTIIMYVYACVYSFPLSLLSLPITHSLHLQQRSRIFVGLGFPYEGPAPLEAIAQGCVFLNPKVNPPIDRTNSKFFAKKPTNRKVCRCACIWVC